MPLLPPALSSTHHAAHHPCPSFRLPIQAHIMQHIIYAPFSAGAFKHTSCSASSLPLLPPAHSSTHHAAHHLCPFFRLRIQPHMMQHIILAPPSAGAFKHTSCSASSLPLFPPAHSSTHHAPHHLCPFFRRRLKAHIMQYIILAPPSACAFKHTSCCTSSLSLLPPAHSSTHHAVHHPCPSFRLCIQAHVMQYIVLAPPSACAFKHTSCSTSSLPLLPPAHSSTRHAVHRPCPSFRLRIQAHVMQYIVLAPPSACAFKHTSCSTSSLPLLPPAHSSTRHAVHRPCPSFRLRIQAHIMQYIVLAPPSACAFKHTSCSTSSLPLLPPAHSSTRHAVHRPCPSFRLRIQAHVMQYIVLAPPSACAFKHTSCSTSSLPLLPPAHSSTRHAVHRPCPSFRLRIQAHVMQYIVLAPPSACAFKHTSCSTSSLPLLPPAHSSTRHAVHRPCPSFRLRIQAHVMQYIVLAPPSACAFKHTSCSTSSLPLLPPAHSSTRHAVHRPCPSFRLRIQAHVMQYIVLAPPSACAFKHTSCSTSSLPLLPPAHSSTRHAVHRPCPSFRLRIQAHVMQYIVLAPPSACAFKHTSCSTSSLPLLPPAHSSTRHAVHHPCPSFRLRIQAHVMQYIVLAPPSACAFKHTSCSTSSLPLLPPAHSSTRHAVHRPCPSFRLRIQAHVMQYIVLAPPSACAFKHTSCSTSSLPLLPPAHSSTRHAVHRPCPSFRLRIQAHVMQYIVLAPPSACAFKHTSCSTSSLPLLPPAHSSTRHAVHRPCPSFRLRIQAHVMQYIVLAPPSACAFKHTSCSTSSLPLLPPAHSSTRHAVHRPCPSFRLRIQAHVMQYIVLAPPSACAFKHTSCSTSSLPLLPPAHSSTRHAVHRPCPSFRLRIQAHVMQYIVLAPPSACAFKHTSCSTSSLPLLPPAHSSTRHAVHRPCPSFRLRIQAHVMQYIVLAPPSACAFKHTSCSTSSLPLLPPAHSSTRHAVHRPCPSFRLRIQAHIMQYIVLAPPSACAFKHTSCSTS